VIYGGRLGGLTVTLGVAGAGIAFALQEVIASFAGWFAIALSGFFRTGDRVQLGGIRGDVIDIGVLRTTLMELGEWVSGDLYSGRVVRIANSFVFKEPVFNYSADFPFLWDGGGEVGGDAASVGAGAEHGDLLVHCGLLIARHASTVMLAAVPV
jgi:small-conductance mechanosensitive channel